MRKYDSPFLPIPLNLQNRGDKNTFNALCEEKAIINDCIRSQLQDLMQIRHPKRKFTSSQLDQLIKFHTGSTKLKYYGNWFYYPWNHNLVHTLPEDEFIEVRTNRNKYKISDAEQATLKTKKIGIVGMSLGSAIAVALATERNFGEIRLADHDHIELANLNRLSFGLHQIGASKVIATARKIMELDPYLKVKIFEKGINRSSIHQFIDPDNKLDLIIEECDDVEVKFMTRYFAKKHRVPVLMETNARPMLDIERFDLEPNRPIFHGWIKDLKSWKWNKIRALTREQKMRYLLKFVRDEGLTDILQVSLDEMGKSLIGYCQPASTFTIGSGLTCEATRLILLDKHRQSGRYILDLDRWLADKPHAA